MDRAPIDWLHGCLAKAELVELIDEAHMEARKDRPNGLRLSAVLGTIAATVQLAPQNPPIIAVKTAAALVGITLP